MTAAIVLAAGEASRMGSPKQVLRVGGERMLDRATDACRKAGLAPIYVILGAHAEHIQRECDLTGVQIVMNPRWAEGMATSLQAGVAEAASHGAEAAVVIAADMPFVSASHLQELARKSAELGTDVASRYDGGSGIPACLRRAAFASIADLHGDVGARMLLRNAPTVALAESIDIDTPEDLERLQAVKPS